METSFEGILRWTHFLRVYESVCMSVCERVCVCVHVRVCVRGKMGCFYGGSFFRIGKILIKSVSHDHLMKLMKIQRLSDERNVKEIV